MRQDLLRGRPTEIDYMNGAIVALAAEHGIACPVNRRLTELIREMERSPGSVRPESLLKPAPLGC